MRLLSLWLSAVVMSFVALAPAGAQVKVDYQKPEVKTRRFDPDNPPRDMPALKAGEAAVCESKFACEVVVEVEITEPAGGAPTAKVAGVNATLKLNVLIWLPIDTTPKIRRHEDGHRQISELFYARGEKAANELAHQYMGRAVEVSPAPNKGGVPNATPAITKLAHEFCQEYLGAIEVPSQVAQEEYDRITDHGRNDVPEKQAVERDAQGGVGVAAQHRPVRADGQGDGALRARAPATTR